MTAGIADEIGKAAFERIGADRDGRLTAYGQDALVQCARFDKYVEPVCGAARMLYAAPNRLTRHRLGRRLIKPEPETDASDFDHCEIVESTAVVSGRDMAELLELVEAAFDEVALLVFRFAIADAIVTA